MSNCPGYERLEEFVAGPLPAPEIASHLETCPTCGAAVDEIRGNRAFLAEWSSFASRLEQSEPGPAVSARSTSLDAPEGYEALSVVARGGQGVVYRAMQRATRRMVALKVLNGGVLAGARKQRRFEREIELVAGLRHPNIVTVYESGTMADGRHYLAMEYVEGKTLDEYVQKVEKSKSQKVEIEAVLRLFVKICEGVNYAHQRGIIHRDLKPANILVSDEATEPRSHEENAGSAPPPSVAPWLRGSVASFPEPRILDFGLAKAIDADPFSARVTATQQGEFMGTLAYAAPESVKGDPKGIDTRTDVYALGVMLYEALAGHPPYSVTGPIAEVVRNITETEPARPSVHSSALNDELDTVVLKALAKDQDRRYQSARDLARDLERYLAGDPIHAKSDSAWYVLRKTARRHKIPLAAAALFFVLLAAFAVSTSIQAGRITQKGHQLAEALSESNIERGRLIGMTGSLPAAEDLLWREFLTAASPPSDRGDGESLPTSPAYWALWELYSRQPCLATMRAAQPGVEATRSIGFSLDGKRLLSCNEGDNVKVWSIPSGKLSANLHHPFTQYRIRDVVPECETLALRDTGGPITFWDAASGQSIVLPTERPEKVRCLGCSGDGETVAVGGTDGTIQVHQISSGRLLAAWTAHDGAVHDLCLSSDGRTLASFGGTDLAIRVWDVVSCKVRQEWKSNSHLEYFCFSPDGRTLAYTDPVKDEITVWDIEAREERQRLAAHGGQIHAFSYSPDGRMIAAGGLNGVLRIYELASQRWVKTYPGHAGDIRALRFSPDGRLLGTIALDGRIRLWDLPPRSHPKEIHGPQGPVRSFCFSPSGTILASAGGAEEKVQLWNTASGQSERSLDRINAPACAVAFHPSGCLLASGSQDGMIHVWELPSGDLRASFRAGPRGVVSLAFSTEGERLAIGGSIGSVELWDVSAEARLLGSPEGHSARHATVAISPDGRTLASAGSENTAILCSAASGQPPRILAGHQGPVCCVQFSPDGRALATSSDDQTVKLWEVATEQCGKTLTGHTGQVRTVCFGPGGRLMASGDHGGNIRLWDVATGRFLASLTAPGVVYSLSFSPDGRTLAAGCDQPRPLLLWDLAYYDRHVAGNLQYQLERVGIDTLDPEHVARLRAWAAEVHARPAHGNE